jgi:hypothetical protein
MVLLASEYDKRRFFVADDLESERKLRIKSVTAEVIGIGAEKDDKLVVWFTNDKRGLVLNKTNNRILRTAFGDDTAGWTDKVIINFSALVESLGRMGIRVRIPPPKQSGQAVVATKPKPSGNGQSGVAAKSKPPVDDELEDEPPAQPPVKATDADEFDDEIDF